MKKTTKRLIAVMLLCTICSTAAFAQHTPAYVEPGSKGELPAIQGVPKVEVDYLPMLYARRKFSTLMYFNGNPIFDTYVDLEFTSPAELGADKYVLEYLINGQWTQHRYEGDDVTEVDPHWSYYGPNVQNVSGFRLRVVGGPYDGKVSNGIELKSTNVPTRYGSGYFEARNYVGYEDEAPYVSEVYGGTTKYDDPTPYIRYNWYRRNPYTYEMTMIEGAHSDKYTYSLEDVGYDVISEICGDGEHLDFFTRKLASRISFPLICSPEYAQKDGVILNTEYVLPSAESLYLYTENYTDTGVEQIDIPATTTERVPGQYVMKADFSGLLEDYGTVFVGYKDNPAIAPYYKYDMWGDVMLREPMIQFYNSTLFFTAKYNGQIKNTTVDVMRLNIEGKMLTETSIELSSDTLIDVPTGKYYLRARATDETMQTYYPNATNWNDAVQVMAPTMDSQWYDSLFVVGLQPKPAPLTGTGVIEGKVTRQPETETLVFRWMKFAAANNEDINVLLYDDKGNTVATTQLTAEGQYRFDNLPFGTYAVVVDAAGYVADTSADITLSADNPSADNVDYTLTNDGKVVRDGEGGMKGDANNDGKIDVADITTIASFILGNKPENFNEANADANSDGKIDVADITTVAGMILGK